MKLEKEVLTIVAEKEALVVKPKYSVSIKSAGTVISILENILGGCRKAIEREGELFWISELYDENQALIIIEEILNILKSKGKSIDMTMIPLDDQETLQLISSGKTAGTYLLGASSLKRSINKTAINNFEDLVALVAIYSQGFIGEGMLNDFIQRKNGEIKIKYIHPLFKKILKQTYGVILYPEQVIEILHIIGGMSLKKAEETRKSMIRKEKEKIDVYRNAFIRGAIKKCFTERNAERTFDLLAYFAQYAISKSLATKHTTYAYQTAYLKAHYPKEFIALNASLNTQ
jgi:DNA polymerase-3 subunit alpha